MTTRRRLLVFGLLAVAVAMPVGVWLLRLRPSAITMKNAAKIRSGMTQVEVEEILAGPARDETSGAATCLLFDPRMQGASIHEVRIREHASLRRERWIGADCGVELEFAGDHVCLIGFGVASVPEEALLAKFRRWFHL